MIDSCNKTPINFKSGLSKDIVRQASGYNAQNVSDYLLKTKGIPSNFKGNDTFAFCCLKSLEIMHNIAKKMGIKFAMPKGIFIEDFTKLNKMPENYWGICNLLPTKLYKEQAIKVPEKTVFFNSNKFNIKSADTFDFLDTVAEEDFAERHESSSHFLVKIMHEFAHVAHEGHLQENFSNKKLGTLIQNTLSKDSVEEFQEKHELFLYENLGGLSTYNPFDTVACDLSKRLLAPKTESISLTPYKKNNFFSKVVYSKNEEDDLDKLVKRFWNGNFN